MDLARRSVTSVAWNAIASISNFVILFVQSVVLARLLPVEVFGTYALANSVVRLSVRVAGFGMKAAFLHRTTETEDEEQAAAVHFTLKSIFTSIWALILVIGSLLFSSGEVCIALIAFTLTSAVYEIADTPRIILTRRVVHRRLALLQVINALLSTVLAVGLAFGGARLWALLATDIVTMTVSFVGLYLWRPVWRIRLAWSPEIMRYFISFGSRSFLAGALWEALDRIDDLWVGVFLGENPLGLYSRAYSFATYPRRFLASPVNQVASGTYAELKQDQRRLSQAFFRINAFLVRTGFLFAGVLALIAPEFIHLIIGDKWLPMLSTFRLMLIFALLAPLEVAISHLFIAVGSPERMMQGRAIQLVVLLVGLFTLGNLGGILGVAVATDLTALIGVIFMLWHARTYVRISIKRLFAAPILALIVGLVIGQAAIAIPGVPSSPWLTGSIKGFAFAVLYAAVLFLFEREQIPLLLKFASRLRPAKNIANRGT